MLLNSDLLNRGHKVSDSVVSDLLHLPVMHARNLEARMTGYS